MQVFPDIFCYILGVKVTDLVSLTVGGCTKVLRTEKIGVTSHSTFISHTTEKLTLAANSKR